MIRSLSRFVCISMPLWGLFCCTGANAKDKTETVSVIDKVPTSTSYAWYVAGQSSVSCTGASCTGYFTPASTGTADVQGAVLKLLRRDGTIVIAECLRKERVGVDVLAALAGSSASPTFRSCKMPEAESVIQANFATASVMLSFTTPHTDASGRIYTETYLIRGFLHPSATTEITEDSGFERETGPREAACGAVKSKLDVRTEKDQHPTPPADRGQARVYIIQQDEFTVKVFGGFPTRYGIDGSWVGGNRDNSYFYVSVPPGAHHLCAEWQVDFAHHVRPLSLARFQAQEGSSYFFRARVTFVTGNGERSISLEPVSPSEGLQLIAASGLSEGHFK